ncbi:MULTISPECIES: hypothetical protein [Ralstonia]|uniref:hypothetical protein n=1 Tax=Ralstonia TaxID=48736 RepID=UPI0012684742|nr:MULTISPECIES: hypothetical protein [Ralstonia]MBL4777663.1 hypothetical protein [Ralstonia sp.]MCM3582240.1 hypothetical protein [Ralstonia pickettii]MDR9383100.1 hypothetical protein [Ralstonia sp. 11b]
MEAEVFILYFSNTYEPYFMMRKDFFYHERQGCCRAVRIFADQNPFPHYEKSWISLHHIAVPQKTPQMRRSGWR